MKTNSLIFLLFVCLLSCDRNKKIITRFDDYRSYLSYARHVSKDPATEELKFWVERLEKNNNDEASLAKLGSIHANLFKSTGLAQHILISDSLYARILKTYPKGNVEIY